MIDDDHYRTVDVNRQLARIYKGTTLVGEVRQGLDQLWYAEQPGERRKTAAVHKVIIANEAIEQYMAAADGHR
jgi:hypothetical protein